MIKKNIYKTLSVFVCLTFQVIHIPLKLISNWKIGILQERYSFPTGHIKNMRRNFQKVCRNFVSFSIKVRISYRNDIQTGSFPLEFFSFIRF